MLINYLGCKVSIACPRDGALFHLASALIYWYDSGWFINCWYRCCCCWRLGRVCQQLINSLPISWWRKTESGYSFVLASWQLDIYGCLHWELYSLRGLGHLILGPIVPLTSFFFKNSNVCGTCPSQPVCQVLYFPHSSHAKGKLFFTFVDTWCNSIILVFPQKMFLGSRVGIEGCT